MSFRGVAMSVAVGFLVFLDAGRAGACCSAAAMHLPAALSHSWRSVNGSWGAVWDPLAPSKLVLAALSA